MKTVLWLVAVLASGGVGFYFGIGRGAQTLGAIAAQNSVSNGVALVRTSLDALAQDDVAHSNQLHEQNFKSALLEIGTYASSVVYHQCSEKERQTMQAARSYAESHPNLFGGPLQHWQQQGLEWCAPIKGGA